MIFLNKNPKRQFTCFKNKLWIYGYSNYSHEDLYNKLENRDPPKDIRGQFAYVYIDNDYWIGCVDHYATTNLYYTKNKISDNLRDLIKDTDQLTDCKLWHEQKNIIKQFTVGELTRYNEIEQIMPEHYCINTKQSRYMDLLNEDSISEPDPNKTLKCLERIFSHIHNLDPVVSFSGGKDSAFLAMALKHFGFNPRLVKVHSDNVKNLIDINAAKDYENIGWNIEYLNVNNTRHFSKDTYWCEDTHWHAGQFSVKRHAVKDKGDIAMSGEVGGGYIVGDIVKYSHNYLASTNNPKIEDLVNIFTNATSSHFQNTPSTIISNVEKNAGYHFILNYFTEKWNRIDKDPYEKMLAFYRTEIASYRLWGESQDYDNTWFSLFSDPDLVKQWHYLSYKYKKKKNNMHDVAKLFSSYTDISWNYRITGMSIRGT